MVGRYGRLGNIVRSPRPKPYPCASVSLPHPPATNSPMKSVCIWSYNIYSSPFFSASSVRFSS